MTYTYKLLGNHTEPSMAGKPIEFILRKEDGVWIPKDEATQITKNILIGYLLEESQSQHKYV